APLPPRLARPRRRRNWRRGRDLNPRHRGYPCTAFPVPHLRPLGHPSACRSRRCPSRIFWRRGEDLNPRGTFWAPIRFRVGRLQPGSATPPRQYNQYFLGYVTPNAWAPTAEESKFSRSSTALTVLEATTAGTCAIFSTAATKRPGDRCAYR